MAEEVTGLSEEKSGTRIGFAILILMQLLSLACVFGSILLLDDDVPIPQDQPGLIWSFVSSLGILFPLLATHFHVINRQRPIVGWFSWWLGIIALFSVLLICLSGFMDEELNESAKNRILTFYIAAVVGGSLGISAY